eukprot:gene1460-12079_t
MHNNVEIPTIGLGTWQVNGKDVNESISYALKKDTALIYKNEKEISKTLEELKIKREEIFITSKLPPTKTGKEKTKTAFEETMSNLKLEYIDLYLIHWPGTSKVKVDSPKNAQFRKESWIELEKLYKSGKIKAIGVSNYTVDHLKELLMYCKIKPMINQVEFHPWLNQSDLLEFCKKEEIILQAYSPLACGKYFGNEVLKEISLKYKKSESQILLRWSLQKGLVVIPKSIKEAHIQENYQIFDFELENDDFKKLDCLNENKHICWDPTPIK